MHTKKPVTVADILARYPKTRPPLSIEIATVYKKQYYENRMGMTLASGAAQGMERWLHRQVARDLVNVTGSRSTLEIGAGTLNQLPYEPHAKPYDIIEPFTMLYEHSPHLPQVRNHYADIGDVPIDATYERITSVATFEHLCDLPRVAALAALHLAEGGTLRVSIPSEGTILWTLGWKLTTGLEFRLRHKLNYGELIAHEHVNTAREIETVLRYFFGDVHVQVFGLCRAVSLYQFLECRAPDLERCHAYLAETQT